MEEIRRRSRQNEQERFEREVEDEFQSTLEEMEGVVLDVIPNDVEIISNKRDIFEHEVFNESPFDVVVRVRATSPDDFAIDRNLFRIPAHSSVTIRITRHPGPIRSYRIKFDATKYQNFFNPSDLHDYFTGPYFWKTFVISYHGAPLYWQDAREINDWAEENELSTKVESEMRVILANEKDNESDQEVYENPSDEPLDEANMNLTNIIFMASNVSFGEELEHDVNEKEDEEYEEETDDKKFN